MNESMNLAVLIAVVSLSSQSVLAHQGGQANAGYVGDARGHLVTDGNGKCVKTSAWTRELALQECDPDLFPKKAAQPAPSPPPEPKPAPVVQPAPKPAPVLEKVSLSAGALFDVGKADLKPQGKKELDALVGKINSEKLGVGQITVTGHTDSTGSKAGNQALSERRAESVKAYLVEKGLNGDRIVTKGMGDSRPVASNKTAAGRAQNRRVDIDIQGERTGASAN
jgi:OOP family OmpA-OmpF porin